MAKWDSIENIPKKEFLSLLRTQRQIRQQLPTQSPPGNPQFLMDYRWEL